MSLLNSLVPGFGIVKGMALTLRRFFEPKATVMYPEMPPDVATRFRAGYSSCTTSTRPQCGLIQWTRPARRVHRHGRDSPRPLQWPLARQRRTRTTRAYAMRRYGRTVQTRLRALQLRNEEDRRDPRTTTRPSNAQDPRGNAGRVRLPAVAPSSDQRATERGTRWLTARDDYSPCVRTAEWECRSVGSRPAIEGRRTWRRGASLAVRSNERSKPAQKAGPGPRYCDEGWPRCCWRAPAHGTGETREALAAGASGLRLRSRAGAEGTIAEVEARGMRGRAGKATCRHQGGRRRHGGEGRYVSRTATAPIRTRAPPPLIETDPYAVIEGAVIAAFAIGAEQAYLSLRATSTEAVRRLQAAVDEASSRNFIGDDVLGSGRRIEVEVRPVQGAYMLGEETVLLKALDGTAASRAAAAAPAAGGSTAPSRPERRPRRRPGSSQGRTGVRSHRHGRPRADLVDVRGNERAAWRGALGTPMQKSRLRRKPSADGSQGGRVGADAWRLPPSQIGRPHVRGLRGGARTRLRVMIVATTRLHRGTRRLMTRYARV